MYILPSSAVLPHTGITPVQTDISIKFWYCIFLSFEGIDSDQLHAAACSQVCE